MLKKYEYDDNDEQSIIDAQKAQEVASKFENFCENEEDNK